MNKSTERTCRIPVAYTETPGQGLGLVERPETPLNLKLSMPDGGHVGPRQAFGTWLDLKEATLVDVGAVPLGREGQRLLALRYIIANGSVWLQHFAWTGGLRSALCADPRTAGLKGGALEARVRQELERIPALIAAAGEQRAQLAHEPCPDDAWIDGLFDPQGPLVADPAGEAALPVLVRLDHFPELRERTRAALKERATALYPSHPRVLDVLYLSATELDRFPATTVTAGRLRYVIVADKGEMGVRAVREAAALGKVPVILHSLQDDADSLQVRLAREHGGFAIGLDGNFRESYANYAQIAERVHAAFKTRFAERWLEELAQAALYPGYGPLAENAAAIGHFRRHGITFIGPMQDVVENIGDKRNFRLLAQRLDPKAVTPGIVIDESDRELILQRVRDGLDRGDFSLPGRIKAANGGGGRGQAIVSKADELSTAINKVLGEIHTFGWDPGVMFEQNIAETIHLEVQVVRDRYGATRHFGMRDCSEQRASQKIQEEAPPAILQRDPDLRAHIEQMAVRIIDAVGYVGAATVELMFKEGKFYFLETNTRIQVEHPVTEASHRIRRSSGLEPLNLVQLQLQVAEGRPIDFTQDQVVPTHVAREFRINAESWNPKVKDSRDGKLGLFMPNGGVFDEIFIPDREEVLGALASRELIEELEIRFDSGFEAGDVLINKDPTFAKLIVAVRAPGADQPYELLRQVSLEVLRRVRIRGRQALPTGKILPDSALKTNVEDHIRILEAETFRRHSNGDDRGRHVNWVIGAFRGEA